MIYIDLAVFGTHP